MAGGLQKALGMMSCLHEAISRENSLPTVTGGFQCFIVGMRSTCKSVTTWQHLGSQSGFVGVAMLHEFQLLICCTLPSAPMQNTDQPRLAWLSLLRKYPVETHGFSYLVSTPTCFAMTSSMSLILLWFQTQLRLFFGYIRVIKHRSMFCSLFFWNFQGSYRVSCNK